MTLQQLSTQMSLSRGALYWFILHSSLCAKFKKLLTCFRDPLLEGEAEAVAAGFGGFGGAASSPSAITGDDSESICASCSTRGEPASGVTGAEASAREGIGKSRCFGSIQEKRRIRCRRTSSRSTSPDGDMLPGSAERSKAGEKVLLAVEEVKTRSS